MPTYQDELYNKGQAMLRQGYAGGTPFAGSTYDTSASRVTPYAQPTVAQTTTVPTPTPAKTNFTYTETPEEKALREATARQTQTSLDQSNQTINEDQIRADTLAQMQAEINAQNAIYADKLARAKVEGTGRLGSEGAIQARRGLLGSDFGASQTQGVVGANEAIYGSIENEKNAQIQSLLSKGRDMGAKAIAEKRAAKEAGLSEYIKSLGGAVESAKSRAKELATVILQSGTLDQYDPASIEQVAKDAGVTISQIKSAYEEQKKVKDAEALKLKTDADALALKAKIDAQKNVPSGFDLYEINPQTGKYEQVANVPKTFAPVKTTSAGVTQPSAPQGQYKSDLDAVVGNAYNLIASANGKVAFSNSIKGARNEADKINAIATVVLKNSSADIRNDFINQGNGIRNLDKAIALLDNQTKTGLINNALQYTFNVFGKDFDPNLAAINSYITGAIQPYRNSVTGAAWGEQEDAEYASLFGSTKYSPKELRSRLVRIKEIMADKSANALQSQINPISEYNPFVNNKPQNLDGIEGAKAKYGITY